MKQTSLLICAFASFAAAQTVTIQPTVSSINPGQRFTVNVVASGVQDLFAYQFTLQYPAGSVALNLLTEGDFLQVNGGSFFIPGTPANGQVRVAGTRIGRIPGVNGSGTLASFTFTANSIGTTPFSLGAVLLLNSSVTPMPVQATGGSIHVGPAPNAPPQYSLSTTRLSFNWETDLPTPASQAFLVSSDPPAPVSITSNANWLTTSPQSCTTPCTVNVLVNPRGLAVGRYTGVVSAGGNPVTVSLYVTDPALQLLLNNSPQTFRYTIGGPPAPAQSLTVNSNGLPVTVTATPRASWLAVTPASAQTPAAFSVSVNPVGLEPGTYSSSIILSSPDVVNSPQAVPVTLYVTAPR